MAENGTRKPNHIEDYLIKVRIGQWFGWTDTKNKVYANLIVLDGGNKPTEEEVNAGLQDLIDKWEEHHQPYRDSRQLEYPKIWEQLEQLYDDIDGDKLDKTGEFYTAQKAVKDKYPKP
jgi:hypothetical protein|tara:strand:+ start:853 stop:1206 length:354 start_codon:yes stop_codon:yes gene_type:complete